MVLQLRKEFSYPRLEFGKIARTKRIRLGDDRDKVNAGAEAFHNFDIERLKSMTSRADEVEAGVNAEINLLSSAWLLLLQHV